jgi:HPt (histidine-containing phosphotransfer) domain-containing protein
MRVYLMTAARQLVELRQAVAQRDAAGVSRIAHSLKSSSLNVGAVRCAEHCRTLERMGHTETHESFEAIFRGLEADFAAVQHAIEEELRRTRDGGGHGG